MPKWHPKLEQKAQKGFLHKGGKERYYFFLLRILMQRTENVFGMERVLLRQIILGIMQRIKNMENEEKDFKFFQMHISKFAQNGYG